MKGCAMIFLALCVTALLGVLALIAIGASEQYHGATTSAAAASVSTATPTPTTTTATPRPTPGENYYDMLDRLTKEADETLAKSKAERAREWADYAARHISPTPTPSGDEELSDQWNGAN